MWASFLLHLVLLVALPGPGGVEASDSIAVTLAFAPAADEAAADEAGEDAPADLSPDPLEPSPAPTEAGAEVEEVPDSVDEIDEIDDPAPEVLDPEPVETDPTPPEDDPLPPPPVESDLLAPPRVGPLTDPGSPEDEPALEGADDAARIAELIRDTRAEIDRPRSEKDYLVLDVWNVVRRSIEEAHDASPVHRDLSAVEDLRKCFVLSFRIDAEGYIFDLSLKTPPGVRTALDTGALRNAIYAINPLAPPPEGMRTPIEFRRSLRFP